MKSSLTYSSEVHNEQIACRNNYISMTASVAITYVLMTLDHLAWVYNTWVLLISFTFSPRRTLARYSPSATIVPMILMCASWTMRDKPQFKQLRQRITFSLDFINNRLMATGRRNHNAHYLRISSCTRKLDSQVSVAMIARKHTQSCRSSNSVIHPRGRRPSMTAYNTTQSRRRW